MTSSMNFPGTATLAPIPAPGVQTITPNVQQPYVVTPLTAQAFAQRILELYPVGWLGPGAPTAAALFYALGVEYAFISQQEYYAYLACRLNTAIDTQLDNFSLDYFGSAGSALPRNLGESDTSFRKRIAAQLLQPQVTRAAIQNILVALTGNPVRMIEPFNPSDTASYNGSYYDYDSNQVGGLYGGVQPYTGFIIVTLPSAIGGQGSLYGYDFAAGYDVFTGSYPDLYQEAFLTVADVITVISNIIALGTQVYVQFAQNQTAGTLQTGALAISIATGQINLTINVAQIRGLFFAFCQLASAVPIWISQTNLGGFIATVQSPTPSGSNLNYVALGASLANVGFIAPPIGAPSVVLPVNGLTNAAFISTNWNTDWYVSAVTSTSITITFTSPSNNAAEVYYFTQPLDGVHAGTGTVAAGQTTDTVTGLTITQSNVPFVSPFWNTAVGVTPTQGAVGAGQISVITSNEAPGGGGQFWWLIYPNV